MCNTNLKTLMKFKNITSSELSKITGIKKRTIDSYMQGTRTPSLENGVAIASVLDVNPAELIEREES